MVSEGHFLKSSDPLKSADSTTVLVVFWGSEAPRKHPKTKKNTIKKTVGKKNEKNTPKEPKIKQKNAPGDHRERKKTKK